MPGVCVPEACALRSERGQVGTFRERSGGMLPESSTNFYPQKAMFPFSKEPEQCVTCVSPMNLLMFSDRKIMSPSWVTTAMKPSKAFRYRLSICWSASASDSFSEQTGKTRGLDGMHACGVKQMQVALTNVCQEWCEGIKWAFLEMHTANHLSVCHTPKQWA